ncbi:hypothetical protein F0562_033931 [Nyssa sinensis]|uniref:Ubiquitin receptor RAD23 n=1 Tax=Nyssa sinensis TaxID=561372 RepID=A0A5J5AF96_9ASTE|nr:hypothetical protein F0562_033931 [Nyssa sinensis]
MLKLIQLWLTLSNEHGNLATCGTGKYCIWQFNVNEDILPSDPIELLRGIPEQAEGPPVARAHASGQVANPPAQPPLPAQPAPVPSSGPNANLLDLSLQGLPDMGSNAAGGGNLDFLRNSPEPMLRELGKLNLHLLRLIQEHQADFVRLINEPIEGGEGNLLGQLASGMPQAITVTLEEREAIERDSGTPSNSLEPSHVEKDPIEATENDGNSNSTCSTSPAPNLRSSFFAVNGVIFSEQSPRIGRACKLVALELFHSFKTYRNSNTYHMALKLDMNKAYDHVEWSFLGAMMEKLGFAHQWIHWIMACLSSVSYSGLLNGD